MARLNGKSAVVTGAGQGLGRRIALRLVEEGAQVMALGRTGAKLEITAERAAAIPGNGRLLFRACDVSASEQVEAAFSSIGETFGKLDILINNAAIFDFFKISEADPGTIRASVDTNLFGSMLCARAATPWLIKAGGGDIVNVSSLSVHQSRAFLAVYAATKAGLENLSLGLSEELKGENIRVMTFRLGGMASDDQAKTFDAELLNRFIAANPATVTAAGSQMQHDTVVTALIELLCLPRDTVCSVIELKPFGARLR